MVRMRRGRWLDHPDVLLERSQLGVMRVAALEDMGVPSATSYQRCLAGGPWRWLLPGVIMMQNAPPTRDQMVRAGLVYAGPRAMVTGAEACRRYGLQVRDDNQVHVLVPHEHKIQSSQFLVVERTRRLPEPWIRDDVPLAPKARAVVDACRRMRTTDPIAKLLIDAIQVAGCTPHQLSHEIESGSPRGTAMPRRILSEIVDLRSVAEKDALALVRRARLPEPVWNRRVFDVDGQFIGRPDAWWDDVAFAWEIDSLAFHFRKEDYARTLARNARYTAAGIVVLQTLPSRLRSEPDEVIAEIRASLAAAGARPRPSVEFR